MYSTILKARAPKITAVINANTTPKVTFPSELEKSDDIRFNFNSTPKLLLKPENAKCEAIPAQKAAGIPKNNNGPLLEDRPTLTLTSEFEVSNNFFNNDKHEDSANTKNTPAKITKAAKNPCLCRMSALLLKILIPNPRLTHITNIGKTTMVILA